MNLIEQLGGYEKAKVVLAEYIVNTLTPSQIGAKYGVWPFTIQILTDALLQYRREHGIFEVGDFIIDACIGNSVIKYHGGYDNHENWVSCFVRHATDAEIKANKRLEVDNAD